MQAKELAYVAFQAPDLDKMETFLLAFGLRTAEKTEKALYMQGYGEQPFLHVTYHGTEAKFVGFALVAKSFSELLTLAEMEKVDVSESKEPGGGYRMALRDPDGFLVEVVYGREKTKVSPSLLKELGSGQWNEIAATFQRLSTPRRVGQYACKSENVSTASRVYRLGHVVLNTLNFEDSVRWYKDRFSFIDSDRIMLKDIQVGTFMRCNRGEEYTDHHTLALFQATPERKRGFGHCAFEVNGVDDLMLGHFYLMHDEHVYEHRWGVGRHVLGSQIFDYWQDPWGHVIEHWTDGDQLNVSDGSKNASIQEVMDTQWGPTMPESYL